MNGNHPPLFRLGSALAVGMILGMIWSPPAKVGAAQADPAAVEITGDWSVRVSYDGKSADFAIDPPDYADHQNERYESILLSRPDAPAWRLATPLRGVEAEVSSVFGALLPGSVSVRLHPEDETTLAEGVDYRLDEVSGNIGRLDGGKIGEKTPVFITYRNVEMRIDSIVLRPDGTFALVRGIPEPVNPVPPETAPGEKRLANLWISGRIERLADENLFPILSDDPPFPSLSPSFLGDVEPNPDPIAARLCPKTFEKLQKGGTVRILAWGDSVTEGIYLPESDRWQHQFVRRLARRFPKAEILLMSESWNGRGSADYRAEPVGSDKNYQAKILDVKPDLIISEFVNDAGLDEAQVAAQYGAIRDDFRGIGAEWIILTPHYIRPDWMGLTGQKNIDEDPRPYVKGIRKFAAGNGIALADASLLYGGLWRRGIPYGTLMVNNINHPNRFGMSLFADALMKLF